MERQTVVGRRGGGADDVVVVVVVGSLQLQDDHSIFAFQCFERSPR